MSGAGLIIIIVVLAFAWLLLIRPHKRRQVQQADMLEGLEPGDEILTAGGVYGHVRAIDEDELTVEIAPGTNVRVAKRAVAAVIPPEGEELEPEAGSDGRTAS